MTASRTGQPPTAPGVPDPPRCPDHRRQAYTATGAADEFIVPLLRDWIEAAVRAGLPADGQVRQVLDIGCGRQPFRALVESRGAEYVGFDVQQSPEGTVAFLGVIDGPLPPGLADRGPFDVILCTEVLEHVSDWPAAFANMSALLAPSGRLIVTCPHVYQLHEEPYDFWRPTSHAIAHFARRSGLVAERVERLGSAWDVLGGVVANMHPLSRRRTLADRAAARAVRFALRRVLFPLLRRRWMHYRFDPGGPLYLANAAVLRKP
ncbi:MAG: Methyltransferase domain protein [Gemmataceae bacterium]|nr:Methyltransferase domain protein [Gemmataceae bacterium]